MPVASINSSRTYPATPHLAIVTTIYFVGRWRIIASNFDALWGVATKY
jgi:hypothetical protein